MWKFYDVTIQITNRLVGGIPRRDKLIEPWLAARAPKRMPENATPIAELVNEVAVLVEASPEMTAVGFERVNGQAIIEARQIKAMLKEAANILKVAPFLDIRNAKSKLAERVFVEPAQIPIAPISAIKEAERVLHPMTAQGPRDALKLSEYVERPTISFTLRVFADGMFRKEELEMLLQYASYNGLGADRSQGEGQFRIVSLTERE